MPGSINALCKCLNAQCVYMFMCPTGTYRSYHGVRTSKATFWTATLNDFKNGNPRLRIIVKSSTLSTFSESSRYFIVVYVKLSYHIFASYMNCLAFSMSNACLMNKPLIICMANQIVWYYGGDEHATCYWTFQFLAGNLSLNAISLQ